MKTFTFLLAAAAMSNQISHSESTLPTQPSLCGGTHSFGDRITCYVRFASPTDFDKVEIEFNRQAPGGGGDIILRESRKLSQYTYEVTGMVGPGLPGAYALVNIQAIKGGAYRSYMKDFNLETDITIQVDELPEPRESPTVAASPTYAPAGTNPIALLKNVKSRPELPDITFLGSIPPNSGFLARMKASARHFIGKDRCGGRHAPNDRLTCYVQFGKAIDPTTLFASFGATDTATTDRTPKDQVGLCLAFALRKFEKVDSRLFIMSGHVPSCRSGQYRLSDIVARQDVLGADRASDRREYNKASDLKNAPTIDLKNPNQTSFPALSYVSSNFSSR